IAYCEGRQRDDDEKSHFHIKCPTGTQIEPPKITAGRPEIFPKREAFRKGRVTQVSDAARLMLLIAEAELQGDLVMLHRAVGNMSAHRLDFEPFEVAQCFRG